MSESHNSPKNPPNGKNGKPRKRLGDHLIPMSEIPDKEMQWLWHPYIPMGCASMLFGPGGLGKSHIACSIIAAVTTGGPLPGQPKPQLKPQNVLLLSAEDDPGAVLKPRLIAAGADLTRIAIPAENFILNPEGIDALKCYMLNFAAAVAFIDPIVYYMGGKIDMNKMNEVRTLTGALHDAAMTSGMSIVIVHHSRKGKLGEDYEQAAGSADFNNAVRSVLFVTRNKGGQTEMRHAKSNYSSLGDTIPYGIDLKVDRVVWGNPYTENTPSGVGKQTLLIQKWLKSYLQNGPVLAVEILAAAEAEGFSHGTLTRAKPGVVESYLVVNPENNRDKAWWWRLV